ncbi:MAG: enoyl-CoA hydratase [Planctomycetota bacterium]|nr:MAG: enoyl-CoA hydratase [Planctomycetota bacterium]
MTYQNLLYEAKERLAIVTVNRPKVLNALNGETISELTDVFLKIKQDDDVAVVILTGAGEKAFVAGADIGELAQKNPLTGKEFVLRGQMCLNIIENLGKPVIAAINGFALGGGCEIAMACTMRIAAENAKLGQPEINLGVIPGFGGTQRLPRLVGKGMAMELALTGEMISAEDACRLGLVNKVVPQGEAFSEAEKMAKKILSKSPAITRLILEAINRGTEVGLLEGLNLEANLFGMACSTEDMKEGTRAFLEKRKPDFTGK